MTCPDCEAGRVNAKAAGHLYAALTQAAPEGWVLVPVEPTEAMLDAWNAYRHNASGVVAWSAMLSASPAPPAQGAGG